MGYDMRLLGGGSYGDIYSKTIQRKDRVITIDKNNGPQFTNDYALSIFRDTRTRLTAIPHPWMDDAVRDILGGNSTLWHKLLSVT